LRFEGGSRKACGRLEGDLRGGQRGSSRERRNRGIPGRKKTEKYNFGFIILAQTLQKCFFRELIFHVSFQPVKREVQSSREGGIPKGKKEEQEGERRIG
jgi:hypothetical protein